MGQTAKERQAKYRAKRDTAGVNGNGERKLSMWVATETQLALRRLARREKTTLRAVLERLVREADEANLAALSIDAPEWDEYFGPDPLAGNGLDALLAANGN
jgi:hypothetical protein